MPTFQDIMAARRSLQSYLYETPIIESNALRTQTGHDRVVLKCESLQRTGSFHFRGMIHKVQQIKTEDLGVNNFITYSTGNSGPALACAADLFQSKGRVVLPEGATETLQRSVKHYKGTYISCAPTLEARVQATEELLQKYNNPSGKTHNQAVLVPPYEDETVLAGYGTLGVELMLQTDCRVDCVVCPVGGGALISSVAIALKGMRSKVSVFAAEPVKDKYKYASFKHGEEQKSRKSSGEKGDTDRVSDRLNTAFSERTRGYVDKYVDGVLHVTDEQIHHALKYVYHRCKLVVDINSAVAVAAVLARPPELRSFRAVCIILSGGNVDLNDIARITVEPKL